MHCDAVNRARDRSRCGVALIQATVYEAEKLRCNLCGEVFTAQMPQEAAKEKFDETANAAIALLKYGTGVAFYRLEKRQESLGKVYKNDEIARTENMSSQQRLQFHQLNSGPLMDDLKLWLVTQLDQKLVEPNSGLGKTIKNMLNTGKNSPFFFSCRQCRWTTT